MSLRFGTYTEFQCPPGRDHAELIWDVIEVGVQADQLGYSTFTCLEHPWFEQFAINPFPLGVFCTLAQRTRNIRFRTLCHTLPLYNPMVLAGQIAQADILTNGRLDVGVGRGHAWLQDPANIDINENVERYPECLDILLKAWTEDRFSYEGKYYRCTNLQVVPRPLQKPHPPVALSLVSPNSLSARSAGERGWIPVSGNFFHQRYLSGHWEKYAEGCEAAGRRPDAEIWRVARCILVTGSDAEAEDYLADPGNGLSYYYTFFRHSFAQGRKALYMIKPDLDVPDEALTVDAIKRSQVIAGSPKRVLERLVALREECGHFGTLLMTGHDWDKPLLWRRSMELLATEVMPRFSRHAGAAAAAAAQS